MRESCKKKKRDRERKKERDEGAYELYFLFRHLFSTKYNFYNTVFWKKQQTVNVV